MWRARIQLIRQFLTGQLSVQFLNFIAGFALLRWLDVSSFAQFSLAFAFQSTMAMLIDLGFAGSIIALVGDRGADGRVIGRYIRSAKHYRARTFGLITAGAAIVYPFVSRGHGWSIRSQVVIFISITAAVACQTLSMYSAPLLIRRQLRGYYAAQLLAAALRNIAYVGLAITHMLGAATAAMVSAAVIALTGGSYRRLAMPLIEEPLRSDPATDREMLRYIAPLAPGVAFAAMQGQVAITIVTLFGSTRSIAEVGALGRLAQLFLLMNAFNSVLIEPYIAKLPTVNVLKRYLQVFAMQAGLAALISISAFIFPSPLLWILGNKYGNLRHDISWAVLGACIGYLCNGMWTMNSARRWVFWWGSILYIVLVIATQIFAAYTMDLSQTHGVMVMNVMVGLSIVVLHSTTAIVGFSRGIRSLENVIPLVALEPVSAMQTTLQAVGEEIQ